MEPIAFGILFALGVLMVLGIQCERHLKRIAAALEACPADAPFTGNLASYPAQPAAPIPPPQPTGPVPLVHNFSGTGDRLPEVQILQRYGNDWLCLGAWQEGHPDLEHAKRKGFAIQRGDVIEEGTE